MNRFAYFLCIAICIVSCDSGDIYPDEYEHKNGVIVSASFSLLGLETFPTSYQIVFGAFSSDKEEPIVSKTLVKPKPGQEVIINLSNLPENAVLLKLCLTTLGKQPLYTFYSMDIPDNAIDSIIIPKQEIRLIRFERIQQQIFTPACVACHGVHGAAGLDLQESTSYINLVNVAATQSSENKMRVKPSDINNSFLINVLEHGDLLSADHTSILSKYNDDIALLKEWVKAGAEKN